MKFVLVGDDFPACKIFSHLIDRAEVVCVCSSNQEGTQLYDWVKKNNIPFQNVEDLRNDQGVSRLREYHADWLLNINSTLILPEEVLTHFPHRALNLHPGLLPAYAGLHTHQWAIRNGETEFGATLHMMLRGVDTGSIVQQCRFPIDAKDTGLTLYKKTFDHGIRMTREVLDQILQGQDLDETPQDLTKRKYYRHQDALQGEVQWHQPAASIINFIRAGNYLPLTSPTYVATWTVNNKKIEIFSAQTGEVSTQKPGAIIQVTAKGVQVACGAGETLWITKARDQKTILNEEGWRKILGQNEK